MNRYDDRSFARVPHMTSVLKKSSIKADYSPHMQGIDSGVGVVLIALRAQRQKQIDWSSSPHV